jgi:RNA polymerase sigma factor (sigma-70 family)
MTPSSFAAALRKLRPGLVQTARVACRCGAEDAEDIVAEVVLVALKRLPAFSEDTGMVGLRRWLTTILQQIARRSFHASRRRVATVPAEQADEAWAAAGAGDPPKFEESVRCLSPVHRAIVLDWLDGRSQEEIAARNRIHRNTVACRLEAAFEILRRQYADVDALEHSYALFAACSRATVYRRPHAPWPVWSRQHPPEPAFRAGGVVRPLGRAQCVGRQPRNNETGRQTRQG